MLNSQAFPCFEHIFLTHYRPALPDDNTASPQPAPRKTPWIRIILAVALTGALLVWLAQGARWQSMAEQFSLLSPLQLGVAALAFALSYLLRAARVFDEFRHGSGAKVHFTGILRITLIHNAMVNILPFRSGEAAFPVLLSRWFHIPTPRAIATLLWLRIQDAFVVMALAAWVWPDLPLGLRLVWMACILLAAWFIPAWARRHPEALDTHGRLRKLAIKLQRALAESTQSNLRGWLWTVANWFVKLAAQSWLLAALLNATLLTGMAGAMGAELAAILPIQGVAGFGTYEAGGAALLRPHGISMAQGLEVTLTLHLFVICCALVAGAFAAVLLPATFIEKQKTESK